MAPEQASDATKVDGRADIYSLGATLWHLVAGQMVFQGKSALDLMMKHMHEPLPDLKKLKPDLPDALVKVIEKMLAKKPEDRYQNCDELLKALEAVKQGAPHP